MDPATIMALTSLAGGLFGGSPAAPPQSQQIYTPEMRDQMLNYLQKFGGQLNTLYGTPSAGAGGVTTQQTSTNVNRDAKTEALAAFFQETQGLSAEEAQKKAAARAADTTKPLNQNQKFVDWLKQGNGKDFGVSVGKGGGIIAPKETIPGGFQVDPRSEALNAGFQNLSAQSLQAASGLPSLFGMDTARALQAKSGLQGMIGQQLGQGLNDQGLTFQNQTDLDALEKFYLQKFGDLQRDTTQNIAGGLAESGFASSNLAANALQKGAYDSQSRFLTEAMAALAGQREGMLSGRAARQSQGMGDMLNAFNTLGANQGMQGVLGGVMSPGQAGLFTDPQSAALAAQLQQQNIGNNMQYAQMMQQGLSTPVQIMPEAPGLFSQVMGAASPFLGMGAAIGGAKLLQGSPKAVS